MGHQSRLRQVHVQRLQVQRQRQHLMVAQVALWLHACSCAQGTKKVSRLAPLSVIHAVRRASLFEENSFLGTLYSIVIVSTCMLELFLCMSLMLAFIMQVLF